MSWWSTYLELPSTPGSSGEVLYYETDSSVGDM